MLNLFAYWLSVINEDVNIFCRLAINKDAGSKVVFNDMSLYFACPCRATKPLIAQLMRIHVVTPKAPVDIIIEPKVKYSPHPYTIRTTPLNGFSSPISSAF